MKLPLAAFRKSPGAAGLILLLCVSLLLLFSGEKGRRASLTPLHTARAQAPTGLADSPWPMLQHDPAHTGRSTLAGIVNQPVLLWRERLPVQRDESGGLSLAADGTIYASAGSKLVAFDPVTQQVNWTFPRAGGSYVVPTVAADGTVYWGTANIFVGVNPDGTELFSGALDANLVFHSGPLIDPSGNVYFGHDGVWSVEAAGPLRWMAPHSGMPGEHTSPALGAGGTVYASRSGRLYAFTPDGEVLWHTDLEAWWVDSAAPIIAPDGTIYVRDSSSNYLHALRPDGTEKWVYVHEDHIWSRFGGMALGPDGTIVMAIAESLYAVTPAGEKAWKVTPGAYFLERPMLDRDGRVYVCDFLTECYAYTPGGTLLWTYTFPTYLDGFAAAITNPVLAADGLMYVLNFDEGGLYISAFADPQTFPRLVSPQEPAGFQVGPGGGGTITRTVEISSTLQPITWTATITPATAAWVTVSQTQGVTPARLELTFTPGELPPGLYQAVLRIAPQGAVGSRLEIPLTLDTWTSHAYLPAISRGQNYNLGFTSRPDGGHGHILVVDRAGVVRPVTHNESGGFAWSPDGERIVFVSFRDGNQELYVMNADGSGVTRLMATPGTEFAPAWSPDGGYIAYLYLDRAHILDAETGQVVWVNPEAGSSDGELAWRP